MKLVLYTGPDCHLCELAKQELALVDAPELELQVLNIRDDSKVYHLYAMRIPVLKRQDNEGELGWPFSHLDIARFIQ